MRWRAIKEDSQREPWPSTHPLLQTLASTHTETQPHPHWDSYTHWDTHIHTDTQTHTETHTSENSNNKIVGLFLSPVILDAKDQVVLSFIGAKKWIFCELWWFGRKQIEIKGTTFQSTCRFLLQIFSGKDLETFVLFSTRGLPLPFLVNWGRVCLNYLNWP